MTSSKRPGVLSIIGNTPLVEIRKLVPHRGVSIWGKLEAKNPGGSIKDRIALSMIEGAEDRGELSPSKTVLEATSGNTGIGLAVVCAVKGYRCMLAMSEGASMERRKILRALGAEILLTTQDRGTDGAIELVYEMAREHPGNYYIPDQFNNPDNWKAHYHGTADEIWRDTKGKVTHVVAGMGTTGTLMGISRRLKELNPQIRVIGVEPNLGHTIQGLKNLKESYVPGIFRKELLDDKLVIEDEEAFEFARLLAKQEGLFCGMSSGAAMAAAYRIAGGLQDGLMVVVLPDGGDRYLTTSLFVPREITTLRMYNTMTRQKEPLEPLEPGKIKIYSCGPTVDDRIHLGVCRRILVADLLKRYLIHKGFQVLHIMNITDLDDRTISGAQREGKDLRAFTDHFVDLFMEDLKALNVMEADHYPRASEHVEEMIGISEELQRGGYAYPLHGSLYFDISKFPHYGRLSRVDLKKIRVGSTVDLDDYQKDNPRDFTLFKRATLSELKSGIYFKTPWGNARPGWHVECAAMSMKYLGPSMDIHTSSVSLIFPHHENEIAICESATGKRLARIWVHSEEVLMDGKKMSRAHGNYVCLEDVLKKGFTARQVRFMLLGTHYRKPIHFTYRLLYSAAKSLQRLDWFARRLDFAYEDERPSADMATWVSEARSQFEEALDDDLNVSRALAAVFALVKRVSHVMDSQGGVLTVGQADSVRQFIDEFNGIFQILSPKQDIHVDDEIRRLLELRSAARAKGHWGEADKLRAELENRGISVVDTPKGTIWFAKEGPI